MPNCPTCVDDKGKPLPLRKHGKWWVCEGETVKIAGDGIKDAFIHTHCPTRIRRGTIHG